MPKRQGSLGNVGIIDLYSQIFKPITTALRQVTMKGIACTIFYAALETHSLDILTMTPAKV